MPCRCRPLALERGLHSLKRPAQHCFLPAAPRSTGPSWSRPPAWRRSWCPPATHPRCSSWPALAARQCPSRTGSGGLPMGQQREDPAQELDQLPPCRRWAPWPRRRRQRRQQLHRSRMARCQQQRRAQQAGGRGSLRRQGRRGSGWRPRRQRRPPLPPHRRLGGRPGSAAGRAGRLQQMDSSHD